MAVYDTEENKDLNEKVADLEARLRGPSASDDLGHQEGLGHSLSDEHADKKVSPRTLNNAEKNTSSSSSGARGDISSNFGGGFWTGGTAGSQSAGQKLRTTITGPGTKRRNLIIGGTLGVGIGVTTFAFLAILPLKIESIVNNLQSHFFASSENAVSNETENLLSGYLKGVAKACRGTVITKDCNVNFSGNSPISALYKGWSNKKLETTLADKYGIEIQYKSNRYYLKAPGLGSNGEDISSHINDGGDLFQEVNRSDVRTAVDNAFSNETKWRQAMYRFKVATLLQEKYGIKRCITDIGCKASDTVTDTLQNKKLAAEQYIAERVIYPRSQILGTVIQCLIGGSGAPNCDPNSAKPTVCEDEADCGELNGEPETEADTANRTTLDKLTAKFAGEDASQIYKDISENKNGVSGYIFEKATASIFGDATAEAAGKAVPVVGWINLASKVVQFASNAGPVVTKLRYAINASSMVGTYMLYRTYADEIKTGHVDPQEVGSFTDSLGPGAHDGNATDANEVGGTATAEASPLYQSIIDGNSPSSYGSSSTSFLQSLLGDKVYAASITNPTVASSDYTCASGSSPPQGSLICPEETLNGGNGALNNLSSALDSPAFGPLKTLASLWDSTAGKVVGGITGWLSSALQYIPGYTSLTALFNQAFQPMISFITNQLIPNPMGTDMSGARTFDMMAGGADVSGNDYAHNGLGGQLLSSQQVANIQTTQTQNAQQQFSQQPFFARIFSTNTPYSLLSRVATAIPLGSAGSIMQNSFASLLSNPFGKISQSFSSIFNSNRVFAASQPQNDPFGVDQYGYPANDPIFNEDPQTVWDQYHCSDGSYTNQWNQEAASNIDSVDSGSTYGNETPVNTRTNPCLLIQASTTSAGATFTDSVLSQADLAGTGGN